MAGESRGADAGQNNHKGLIKSLIKGLIRWPRLLSRGGRHTRRTFRTSGDQMTAAVAPAPPAPVLEPAAQRLADFDWKPSDAAPDHVAASSRMS